MSETIFQKIIDKELPADIVYEDEFSLVFSCLLYTSDAADELR